MLHIKDLRCLLSVAHRAPLIMMTGGRCCCCRCCCWVGCHAGKFCHIHALLLLGDSGFCPQLAISDGAPAFITDDGLRRWIQPNEEPRGNTSGHRLFYDKWILGARGVIVGGVTPRWSLSNPRSFSLGSFHLLPVSLGSLQVLWLPPTVSQTAPQPQ